MPEKSTRYQNRIKVYELVRTLRGVVSCDIECHFHNDTGCAIGNAYAGN